jgi:hypothetical protein
MSIPGANKDLVCKGIQCYNKDSFKSEIELEGTLVNPQKDKKNIQWDP